MFKRFNMRKEILWFFLLISFAALGGGLGDSVYANFFKEVYNVDSVQRGFIEFPRELPGFLCVLLITIMSSLGDIRIAVIAQVLSFIGLLVLGLFTPTYGWMLVFLFINSMGGHLFMPIQDSIGMSLAEEGYVGRRMGQYASVKSAVAFVAAVIVFFGFRTGFFSFSQRPLLIFVLGAAAFALAVVASLMLLRTSPKKQLVKRDFKLIFRKEYKYYYILTVLNGAQKQIAYVFGSWVVIDLLLQGADSMALLYIISSFVSIFFMDLIGKWMDKLGVKKMMLMDALTFIGVYVLYGLVVWGITSQLIPSKGWTVIVVYALFVMDRLSMQIGVVRAVYLRSIARSTEEVTQTLSMGTSMDHIVSIAAAMIGGVIWKAWGSQWVFFVAASLSLVNLVIAFLVKPDQEKAEAERYRREHELRESE